LRLLHAQFGGAQILGSCAGTQQAGACCAPVSVDSATASAVLRVVQISLCRNTLIKTKLFALQFLVGTVACGPGLHDSLISLRDLLDVPRPVFSPGRSASPGALSALL